MRIWQYALLVASVIFAGCATRQTVPSESQPLTPASSSAIEDGVRAFTRTVANDVTQDGPAAWRRHFADSPSFFMAADGRLVFPNSAAAITGIQELARTIKKIELQWGDDLRVDPLTPNLAVVAASWHEVMVSAAGQRMEESGFFTAVAEYRGGRWQFRNAHWSVAGTPSRAP